MMRRIRVKVIGVNHIHASKNIQIIKNKPTNFSRLIFYRSIPPLPKHFTDWIVSLRLALPNHFTDWIEASGLRFPIISPTGS